MIATVIAIAVGAILAIVQDFIIALFIF